MHHSRLPRRSTQHPSVAELVRKYQDYLPPQGVQELAKTAFAPPPPVSESDQEYIAPRLPRSISRNKTRHQSLTKDASFSDFEQGYAANVAPRHLTHTRRPQGRGPRGSRIPGPVLSSAESVGPSRRASPDKRVVSGPAQTESTLPRTSSDNVKPTNGSLGTSGRVKTSTRLAKDKAPNRSSPNSSTRSYRRQPPPGTKVSSITKHFERINRETERVNRRYTVIRGKRARPVASARAKVEILDSVKDAVKYDESESSESSSEADDEGDGNDGRPQFVAKPSSAAPIEGSAVPPQVVIESAVDEASSVGPPSLQDIEVEPATSKQPDARGAADAELDRSNGPSPLLSSPILKATLAPPSSPTPPGLDFFAAPPSLLQALGLWIQPPQGQNRRELDVDDLLGDPEHIFRDSSMVVRTDEPTSIIALALK